MYVNGVSTSLPSSLFSGNYQQWEKCPNRMQWQSVVLYEPTQGNMLVGHSVILKSSVNEPWTLLDSSVSCVQILGHACVFLLELRQEFFRTTSVESTWVPFYLTSTSLRAQFMELANEAWILYHVSLKVHCSNAKLRTNENLTRAVSRIRTGQILCTLQKLWKKTALFLSLFCNNNWILLSSCIDLN